MPEEDRDYSNRPTEKLPDRDDDFDYGKTLPDGQHERHPVKEFHDGYATPERPVRYYYKHLKCGGVTRMPTNVAKTIADEHDFYDKMFCVECHDYFPCGSDGEFVWNDNTGRPIDEKVGT